eukprot:g36337.t1
MMKEDEEKDSEKKSKLQQNMDMVEDEPMPAATEKELELEVGSSSQISNVDSKDPKESGEVKPQSEVDVKAGAAGVSQSGQGKSDKDTAKPKSAKDQSANYNTGRSDSVQVNHKATQHKVIYTPVFSTSGTACKGTDEEQAILDLVLCNELGIVNDLKVRNPFVKSDHRMVEFRIQME